MTVTTRKKKVVKRKTKAATVEEKLGPDRTAASAGSRIKAVAHGFRLRFSWLSRQRQFDDATKSRMAEHVHMDVDSLGASKRLYAKHPALTAVQRSKTAITDYFSAMTLPYPESGVRLLPVKTSTEEEQQQEVRTFLETVREKIADFEESVEYLADNWESVLAAAEEKLQEQFDSSQYPLKEDLKASLAVRLETYNFKLPNYLKQVDPEEYARQAAILQGKFEEAAKMQETAFLAAFNKAVGDFLGSVGSYHSREAKRFSDSAVTKVFRAIETFREKCARFGILNDSSMNALVTDLRRAMTGGGLIGSSAAVAKELRSSAVIRDQMLANVKQLHGKLLEYASNGPARKLDLGD